MHIKFSLKRLNRLYLSGPVHNVTLYACTIHEGSQSEMHGFVLSSDLKNKKHNHASRLARTSANRWDFLKYGHFHESQSPFLTLPAGIT